MNSCERLIRMLLQDTRIFGKCSLWEGRKEDDKISSGSFFSMPIVSFRVGDDVPPSSTLKICFWVRESDLDLILMVYEWW